jgi:hypothetical protein
VEEVHYPCRGRGSASVHLRWMELVDPASASNRAATQILCSPRAGSPEHRDPLSFSTVTRSKLVAAMLMMIMWVATGEALEAEAR